MWWIFAVSLLNALFYSVFGQELVSPCPGVFHYETDTITDDGWYGYAHLTTKDDLEGVFVHVVLDRPAITLGTFFGNVTTKDKIDYFIQNPRLRLEVGPPVVLRFFIKYDPYSPTPKIVQIRLNGRKICPIIKKDTVIQLHLSEPVGQGNRPITVPPDLQTATVVIHDYATKRPPYNYDRENNGGYNNRPNNNNNYNQVGTLDTGSQTDYSTNRRPGANQGGSFASSSSSSSNTGSNPLHGGGSISTQVAPSHDRDYFVGDFSIINRPADSSSRPITTTTNRKPECGTTILTPRPLITNGASTQPGEFPWHAALYINEVGGTKYICGGSLISQEFIVTAAHCVARESVESAPIDPTLLLVYLGKYDLQKFTGGIQTHDVSKIFLHPNYNRTSFHNDIALLKLSKPAELSDAVRTVCLWSENKDLSYVKDRLGTVVGWGFDAYGVIRPLLMQAKMPVVDNSKCIYSNREFYSRFTHERSYCAGFRNGTAACNGDSGGGMFFQKLGPRGQATDQWQIRGLVSLGIALQNKKTCDPNDFIVFTDVAQYLDWIRNTINNN